MNSILKKKDSIYIKIDKDINFFKNLKLKNKFFILNRHSVIFLLSNNFYKFFNFLKIKNNTYIYVKLKNKKIFTIFKSINKKITKKFLFLFCSFVYSKIFLKVGLGFRKKYYKKFNSFLLNIGIRKWAIFKTSPSVFFFNVKRRNLFLFSNTKKNLYYYLVHLKYLRKETVYKIKGIMTLNRIIFNKKISRSILFARRVKFKAFKLKLTKKQKQRR